MTSFEALAVARMRQWSRERAAARSGHTTDYTHVGWRQRQARMADARLVRIMDFERALDGLNETDQLLLLFKYRDQMPDGQIAEITGHSTRALCYKIPQARQRLAERLDRLDLL